jgi:hypothetical protein
MGTQTEKAATGCLGGMTCLGCLLMLIGALLVPVAILVLSQAS